MEDCTENKAGLHKEISSIFSGVPIPTNSPAPDGSGSTGKSAGGEPVSDAGKVRDEGAAIPAETIAAVPSFTRAAHTQVTAKAKDKNWNPLQKLKDRLSAGKQGTGTARQKTMMVLIPVLAVVLLFVLSRAFVRPARTMADVSQADGPDRRANGNSEIEWEIPPVYPSDLRDPMELPPAMAAAPDTVIEPNSQGTDQQGPEEKKLIVKGILHTYDRPSAVVGTDIVHEGDTIMGTTVVKINKSSVEFASEGRRWTQNVEP
jgi:hypothetical protein